MQKQILSVRTQWCDVGSLAHGNRVFGFGRCDVGVPERQSSLLNIQTSRRFDPPWTDGTKAYPPVDILFSFHAERDWRISCTAFLTLAIRIGWNCISEVTVSHRLKEIAPVIITSMSNFSIGEIATIFTGYTESHVVVPKLSKAVIRSFALKCFLLGCFMMQIERVDTQKCTKLGVLL